MRKPLLPEVSVARGLAILAVLVIHGTSRPVTLLEPTSTFYPIYSLANRAAQFAVPLFFLLSALVLAYQFGEKERVDWKDFYLRRFRQVVVPYLAWTTLYAVARVLFLEAQGPTLARVASWYLTGKGFFHLYFLAVLIQFYAVLPLIHRLWRALPGRGSRVGFGLVFVSLAAIQAVLYLVDRTYLRPHYPYSTVLNYVIPLGLGLWLGSNVERWGAWWRSSRWLVGALALAAAAVYLTGASYLTGAGGLLLVQATSYVYVSLAALVVFFLARGAGGWLARLGEASFGVYLIHPAILTVWEGFWRPAAPAAFHLSVVLGYAVMLAGSWALTWLIGRTPLRRILLGNR